jgi:uncharacterized membrane protein YccF (DUF307 family)
VVKKPTAGVGSLIGNVIWFVFAGIPIVIGYLITAFLLAITIIGLPLALGNIKMIPIALWPFGREIVQVSDVEAAMYGDSLV